MLIHLKLEHFKIWNTTGPIRLAPLTLLLGTNSSGKSSLIQSLLLIRQTVKGIDDSLDLNLGNPETTDSVTLGHIVMVEEPESHLHPLAQSQLAELFAKISAERGVQFIVETHSEHLFRRMQTLIAKQELKPEQAAMYFVERDGKQAKLRMLDLDDVGRIRNWPPMFFGDTLGETREQTELAIKRAKALRAADGNVPS